MTFNDFNFDESLNEGMSSMNFKTPTPIQQQAIPEIMAGKDIIACAQTGTGKTAAYLLPVINHVLTNKTENINTVIIVPTRELATQVDQVAEGLTYFTSVETFSITGGGDGASYERERKALKKGGADIIIATPGRLISHLASGYVHTKDIKHLVLDEADKMMDMGFYDDIVKIIRQFPEAKQNILLSATMPPRIRKLASELMKDPVQINIAVSMPAEKIKQEAYVVHEEQKLPILKEILKAEELESIIIFASTKINVRALEKTLKKAGLDAFGIHSDLEQSEREVIFNNFKNRQFRILIGTDLISRGIDVENIDLVINYDIPGDAEDYIHRIGRTARAATKGRAISFINEKDQGKFRRIEKLMDREVEKMPVSEAFGPAPEYKKQDSNKKKPFRKKKFFKKKES